jgi:hypothetical protein
MTPAARGCADGPRLLHAVAVLVALVAALALASPALGVEPIRLGAGEDPEIDVDDAGTAHVVWKDSEADGDAESVRYCRYSRARTGDGCDFTTFFGYPPGSSPFLHSAARPFVFAFGPRVRVLEPRSDGNWFHRSSDSGSTWSVGHSKIGVGIAPIGDAADGVLDTSGPPYSISYVTERFGLGFQNANAEPSPAAPEADWANLSPAPIIEGTVARDLSINPRGIVAAWFDPGEMGAPDAIIYRTWSRSGDPNDEATWNPAGVIDTDVPAADGAGTGLAVGPNGVLPAGNGAGTRLAGGQNGVFVLYRKERATPAGPGLVVRKFTGVGWTAPVAVTGASTGLQTLNDLYQDAAGRLHVIYGGPTELRYQSSSDGGTTWSATTVIGPGGPLESRAPQVAAAPDGRGFVAFSFSGSVYLVPIRPVPAGGGNGTGATGNGPPGDIVDGCCVRDSTRPALSRLALKPHAFAALGGRRSSIVSARRRTVRRGATVRYGLSEAANVTFKVERSLSGRRRGRRCVVTGRSSAPVAMDRTRRRGRRCTRYKEVTGNFTHAGSSGANSFRFSGRLNGKRLSRGRYRLLAVPKDAAGNNGRSVRTRFRIVRARGATSVR